MNIHHLRLKRKYLQVDSSHQSALSGFKYLHQVEIQEER